MLLHHSNNFYIVDLGGDGEPEEQQQHNRHDQHDRHRAEVAQEVKHLFLYE